MAKRGYYILGGALLVMFAAFSLASFNKELTPYVSFAQARELRRTVQIAGALEKGSSSYDERSGALSFTLLDKTNHSALRVRYNGLRPANFEDAISIVAIGRYDAAAEELRAEKLLVKCPSKYQGAELTEKTYG